MDCECVGEQFGSHRSSLMNCEFDGHQFVSTIWFVSVRVINWFLAQPYGWSSVGFSQAQPNEL